MARHPLGEFEELVLLATNRLRGGAYTVSIQQQIEDRAGRTATLGAIYTALSRLREKGYVESKKGDVTPRRGGKRKRYYTITPAGVEALHEARMARDRLWVGAPARPGWTLQ